MGSYKWGYKSPNMGYNRSYPTYNPAYITTHEPPSVELPGLRQLFKSPGCVLLKGLRQEVGAAAFLEFGVEGSGV